MSEPSSPAADGSTRAARSARDLEWPQLLDALSADGKLIKRPLLLGKDFALVAFREDDWAETLS